MCMSVVSAYHWYFFHALVRTQVQTDEIAYMSVKSVFSHVSTISILLNISMGLQKIINISNGYHLKYNNSFWKRLKKKYAKKGVCRKS